MSSESDRKHQKRVKPSAETNGMKRSNGVSENQNGKWTNGVMQNGLANGSSLPMDGTSQAAATFQSLVAAQKAGPVGALQWISLQNAKNGFPFPSPLVQAGAVPPPNLPMPVGSVPDASFQTLPANENRGGMALNHSPLANHLAGRMLPLNQNSLFQLSQYMQGSQTTIPAMIQSIESSQMQELSHLIAANSNHMMAMQPPLAATNPPSLAPSSAGKELSESKQAAQGVKRSHGPSMDRCGRCLDGCMLKARIRRLMGFLAGTRTDGQS